MMIGGLLRILTLLEPEQDWGPLARVYNHLRQTAAPSRDKLSRLVRASDLFTLGLRLMNTREDGPDRPTYVATRYRDGLIIALLIACPMRIKNLASLVIGQHLMFDGGAYWLKLTAAETKSGRPYHAAIPAELTPYIEGWLRLYRPMLQLIGAAKDQVGSIGGHPLGRPLGPPPEEQGDSRADQVAHQAGLRQGDLAAPVSGLCPDRAGGLCARGDRHRVRSARPRRPPDDQEALHPGGRDEGASSRPGSDRSAAACCVGRRRPGA